MIVVANDPELNESKVLAYRSPRIANEWTARIGMMMFLASWAMMFAALFFVYGGIRAKASVWPPMQYPALPLLLPSINTAVIFCSSMAFQRGLGLLRQGRVRLFALLLLLTTLLGATFLALQVTVWLQLSEAGLHITSGAYGSVFYAFTWLHAAHVIVGVVALGVLTVFAFRGAFGAARMLKPRLWAMYWHFVGMVWVLLFVTIYLV